MIRSALLIFVATLFVGVPAFAGPVEKPVKAASCCSPTSACCVAGAPCCE